MIIGLTGRKRAGKDSAAAVLRSRGFAVDSFAAPIRHFVAEMLGWGPDQLDARKEEPLDFLDGVTPRRIMQLVGTECGRRMVHPELWIRLMTRRLAKRTSLDVVISDARFDNEAHAIHAAGGIVVEIQRPGLDGSDTHVSEDGISPRLIDRTIVNDGTLDDLRRKVADWLAVHRA